MKATYLGKSKDKYSDAVHLFYRYRGQQYMITDPHNGYSESLAAQHKSEQARIDRELNDPQEIKPYTGEVDKALNALFELWEG